MRFFRSALFACASGASLLATCVAAHAGTATYSIGFYAINAGGTRLRGQCYVLSGSVAQVTAGYASGGVYAQYIGFWTPALAPSPLVPGDEIYFNGFEEC